MFLPRLNISCYVFTYSKSESLQLNRASYEIIRNFTPKQGLIKSDWKLKYSTFNSKVQMNNIYYIKLDVHLKYPLPSHAPRNKKLYLPRDRFCWTCFYLSQHLCQEHHAKSILLIFSFKLVKLSACISAGNVFHTIGTNVRKLLYPKVIWSN